MSNHNGTIAEAASEDNKIFTNDFNKKEKLWNCVYFKEALLSKGFHM